MTGEFVAINFIACKPDYCERFEHLFSTRAREIDKIEGFIRMQVLRPNQPGEQYLVVSHWQSEAAFRSWMKSPEFLEGHKRGFADVQKAKEAGEEPPMTSCFHTYQVFAE